MKFEFFFATQYKQSFIYFGASAKTDGKTSTRRCVATIVKGVDKEDWALMPQLQCDNPTLYGLFGSKYSKTSWKLSLPYALSGLKIIMCLFTEGYLKMY